MNNDSDHYGLHQSQYRADRPEGPDSRRYEGFYDRSRGGYRGPRGHHSRGPSRPNGRGGYGHLRGSYSNSRDSYRDSYREPYREPQRESFRDGYRGSNRDGRDSQRDTREPREIRDPRDFRDSRDSRSRDPRDSREGHYNGSASRGSYGSESRDLRDSQDPRDMRDTREAREFGYPRDQRDGRGPDDLDSRDNRHTGLDPRPFGDHRSEPRDQFHSSRDNGRIAERSSLSRENPANLGPRSDQGSLHPHTNHTTIVSNGSQGGSHGARPAHTKSYNLNNHRDTNSLSADGPRCSSPWVLILRIKDPKVITQMESNYRSAVSVNATLSKLQIEAIRLENTLATFDVYAKRDALNVEQCNQKLEEFTYL